MIPRFEIRFTDRPRAVLDGLRGNGGDRRRKRVGRALTLLANDPWYPSLHSHKQISASIAEGYEIFGSYIEHRTPGAWRVVWRYGPGPDEITVLGLGPHP